MREQVRHAVNEGRRLVSTQIECIYWIQTKSSATVSEGLTVRWGDECLNDSVLETRTKHEAVRRVY